MKDSLGLRAADRQREVHITQGLAGTINRQRGTDWYATEPDHIGEDALILSSSDKSIRIAVQVVSAPDDSLIRLDNKNRRKLEAALGVLVEKRGISIGDLCVFWTEEAIRRGSDWLGTALDSLATEIAIVCATGKEHFTLRAETLYYVDPRLTRVLHYVRYYKLPEQQSLRVSSAAAFWAPRDGSWIRAAVEKKVAKYPASDGWLLVDGVHYFDEEQIDAYGSEFEPERVPFVQLWIARPNGFFRMK